MYNKRDTSKLFVFCLLNANLACKNSIILFDHESVKSILPLLIMACRIILFLQV